MQGRNGYTDNPGFIFLKQRPLIRNLKAFAQDKDRRVGIVARVQDREAQVSILI
jgi:hypothetical protein